MGVGWLGGGGTMVVMRRTLYFTLLTHRGLIHVNIVTLKPETVFVCHVKPRTFVFE